MSYRIEMLAIEMYSPASNDFLWKLYWPPQGYHTNYRHHHRIGLPNRKKYAHWFEKSIDLPYHLATFHLQGVYVPT